MRLARVLLVMGLIAALDIQSPAPVAAAAGCTYDGSSIVTVNLTTTGDVGVLRRSGNAIALNGSLCGAATVTNTDRVTVNGAGGVQTFAIDQSMGPFAPGKTAEATGVSEIEFVVDLKAGDDTAFACLQGDVLLVVGTGTADAIRLGANGINLNADDDGDDVRRTSVESLSVSGGAGGDSLSRQGASAPGGRSPSTPSSP